jgi:hypothetical protein
MTARRTLVGQEFFEENTKKNGKFEETAQI